MAATEHQRSLQHQPPPMHHRPHAHVTCTPHSHRTATGKPHPMHRSRHRPCSVCWPGFSTVARADFDPHHARHHRAKQHGQCASGHTAWPCRAWHDHATHITAPAPASLVPRSHTALASATCMPLPSVTSTPNHGHTHTSTTPTPHSDTHPARRHHHLPAVQGMRLAGRLGRHSTATG